MLKYRVWSTLAMVWCCLAGGAGGVEGDENRPYEFGFTIDGEQHRHEMKDDNGIIMGEFGFLTADGVYHVTVYATDENGNFKILSMKSLRVQPFPTSGAPQSKALHFPKPDVNLPQTIAQMPASVRGLHSLPEAAPVRTCSGCSIPTSPKPPKQLTDLAVVSRNYQQFPPYPENINSRGRQFVGVHGENTAGAFVQSQQMHQYGQQFGPSPEHNSRQAGPLSQQLGQFMQPPGINIQEPAKFGQNTDKFGQQQIPFDQQPGYNAKQLGKFNQRQQQYINTGKNQTEPTTPMLISAQMSIVDGNTDIHKRGPSETEGLPNGLTKDNMLKILYTFNYTLGFHAQSEEGYTNGAKKGYYYVTRRDGVRTRIDYIADSEGFHPKISTEVLELLSEDVPKPETEKEGKYGLRGYEFKWLYYPPSSQ